MFDDSNYNLSSDRNWYQDKEHYNDSPKYGLGRIVEVLGTHGRNVIKCTQFKKLSACQGPPLIDLYFPGYGHVD